MSGLAARVLAARHPPGAPPHPVAVIAPPPPVRQGPRRITRTPQEEGEDTRRVRSATPPPRPRRGATAVLAAAATAALAGPGWMGHALPGLLAPSGRPSSWGEMQADSPSARAALSQLWESHLGQWVPVTPTFHIHVATISPESDPNAPPGTPPPPPYLRTWAVLHWFSTEANRALPIVRHIFFKPHAIHTTIWRGRLWPHTLPPTSRTDPSEILHWATLLEEAVRAMIYAYSLGALAHWVKMRPAPWPASLHYGVPPGLHPLLEQVARYLSTTFEAQQWHTELIRPFHISWE